MAFSTFRIVAFACVFISLTACTPKQETAKVTVRLPGADSSASTKSNSKISAMTAQSPTPTPTPTPFVSQMGWGLDRPTALAQTKCFAIVVEVPDSNGTSKKCTSVDSMHDIKASAFAGLSPVGSTIEMNIPTGTKRKFHVFAFAAESASDCATVSMGSLMKTSRLSAPSRIASKETDILPGNNDLEIVASYDSPDAFDTCEWTAPADLTGGSLTINAGATATNSLALNVVPFVPFVASEAYYTFDSTCSSGGTWEAFTVGHPMTAPAGEGVKTVRAKFRDSQGAVSGCLSASITLDQTAPQVSIDTAVAINVVRVTNYSLSGTCSENGRPVQWSLNGGAMTGAASCLANTWMATGLVVSSLPDGNVNISAMQTDAATNSGANTALATKDTILPTVAITSPLPSTYVNAAQANAFLISGTCSEVGQTVNVSAAGVTATSTCSAGSFSVPLDVSSLGDGNFFVTAATTDAAGNSNTVLAPYMKDTLAPSATATGIPTTIVTTNSTTLMVGGADVVKYRYFVTLTQAACNVLSNYAPAVSIATPFVVSTPTPNTYYACILGADLAENVQSAAAPKIVPITKGPVTISFAEHMSIASEAVTMRNIPITISPPAAIPLTIEISTQGTAVFGTNYNTPFASDVATVIIPANTSLYNFPINVTGTNITTTEAVMSLSLRGSPTSDGIQLGISDHQAWIEDSAGVAGSITQLALGTDHGCGINNAGRLYCWGMNEGGQLGNGSYTDSPYPVAVDAGNTYSKVAAGIYTTCAITTSGDLKCWGRNDTGQLGIGNIATKNTPQAVMSNVSQVAVGNGFACAITTVGGVMCWGDQTGGRLGNGSAVGAAYSPISISIGNTAQKITLGWDHACALRSDGSIVCWGNNAYGQLGQGNTSGMTTPTLVASAGTSIDVSAGLFSTCSVRNDNKAFCWGDGGYGKLGNLTQAQQNSPVAAQSASNFTSIRTGSSTTCATEAGTNLLKCWGYGYYGILGDGKFRTFSYAPIAPTLPGAVSNFALAVNGNTVCATSLDRPYCWGSGRRGILGNGFVTGQPSIAIGPQPALYKFSLGRGGCAITVAYKLLCWGPNDLDSSSQTGAVGDGTNEARNGFVYIDPTVGYAAVSVGLSHSCAVTNTGDVKCWGQGTTGQLGTADNLSHPTPTFAGAGFQKVAVGSDSSCAIKSVDKSLWCWGNNTHGQVGDGTFVSRAAPVAIMAGSQFLSVDLGAGAACAITLSNTLFCWGKNTNGQVGDGTIADRAVPYAIAGSYSSVSVGSEVMCAINTVGDLACAGRNAYYDLGLGTNSPLYYAALQLVGSNYTQVDVGMNMKGNAPGAHTCALQAGAGMKCWGPGGLGQHAPLSQPVSPTAYDAGNYNAIYVGEAQTCGVTVAGQYLCHGFREEAELPLGVPITRPNLVTRIRY